jgi:hypothetical protein
VVLNTQMWRCCYETFNGTSDLDGFFRLMMWRDMTWELVHET